MMLALMLSLLKQSKEAPPHLRVLFLCRHNRARSQIAAALLHAYSHGAIETASAGSEPVSQMHPFTLRLMERIGIDLCHTTPKSLEHFSPDHFDAIITLCDQGHEACPVFPGETRRVCWTFPTRFRPRVQKKNAIASLSNSHSNLLFGFVSSRPFWSQEGTRGIKKEHVFAHPDEGEGTALASTGSSAQ